MTFRHRLLTTLRNAIGDDSVVWFGSRALDGTPLQELGDVTCLGITGPTGAEGAPTTYEELKGTRVDIDAFDAAKDGGVEGRELLRIVRDRLRDNAVLVAYSANE